MQSFLDEVAHATRRDPLELRLALLGAGRELDYAQHGGPSSTRAGSRTAEGVAEIDWGRPLPGGRGLGLAAHFTFGGYAAHAMEVAVATAAICGRALRLRRRRRPADQSAGHGGADEGGTIDGLAPR